jgi:hypothetical protein
MTQIEQIYTDLIFLNKIVHTPLSPGRGAGGEAKKKAPKPGAVLHFIFFY